MKSVVLKDVQSPERLFDETALFLHRVGRTAETEATIIERLHQSNEALHGYKVLVVDDDARNIFALTTVLEPGNGRDERHERPSCHRTRREHARSQRGVDGHHDARDGRIYDDPRNPKKPEFRSLPFSPSLTAKASEGRPREVFGGGRLITSRNRSMFRQLLSMLRVWLYR